MDIRITPTISKLLCRLLLVSVALVCTWSATVPIQIAAQEAKEPCDERILKDLQVAMINCSGESAAKPCTTSGPLVGNDNEEKAYNFFKAKDPELKPYQIAGIVANLKAESGVNPLNIQDPAGETQDPSGLTGRTQGWGIMQWTPGAKIIGLMQQAGITTPVYELSSQLELVWWHFNNTTPRGFQNVYPGFKQTATIFDATYYFMDKMEGPEVNNAIARTKDATDLLARLGGGTSGGGAGSVTCGGGGQVVGKYALPLPKDKIANVAVLNESHWSGVAIDIQVPSGTPVFSITDGKITQGPVGGDCGNGVMVDAGNGVMIIYCHGTDGGTFDDKSNVGDTVTAGQRIMTSDNTGHSSGPHLHVGIRINGQDRCPQQLLAGIYNGTPPDIMSLPSSGCSE